MSFLGSKELLNVARCNRLLFHQITPDVVVRSLLYSGGNEMQSMKNVYRHLKTRAIHSMTAFRTLTLCTGYKCEFCDKNTETDIFNETGISAGRTNRVRPQFAVKACWACLGHSRTHRTATSPKRTISSSLTIPWHKVDDDILNLYYIDNSRVLFDIWSHPRVLAYPYGLRWFDNVDGDLIPVGESHEADFPMRVVMLTKSCGGSRLSINVEVPPVPL